MPYNMYGPNLLKNSSAETGDTTDWDNVENVTVVAGGVDGAYTFKFAPTASMDQTVGVPSQPFDLQFEVSFLPGRDIKSAAQVRAEIVILLTYGDGSTDRYVIPGKTFIEGAGF